MRYLRIVSQITLLLCSIICTILHVGVVVVHSLSEDERLIEYNKRGFTWPLNDVVPNTIGWKTLMINRFNQIANVTDATDRYNGYYQTMHSASVVPNFTQYGFGLGQCSDNLISDLRTAIYNGINHATDNITGEINLQEEQYTESIDAPLRPWFIDAPDLTNRVLKEMLPYAEEWSGMELEPHQAYGLRLYRNYSQLHMHVDRMQTHIISFILHIDSSTDAEPWPIFIEDFNGTTHEVTLTSGDILFYESSKCFHGRPKRLNGTWYSSIFVHYYPKGWQSTNHDLEAHYAIPPIWANDPVSIPSSNDNNNSNNNTSELPKLEMRGTTMTEPDCPNNWCLSTKSKQWSGPGEKGYWIAPNFERFPLKASLDIPVQSGGGSDEL
jgi:hypothetical protein